MGKRVSKAWVWLRKRQELWAVATKYSDDRRHGGSRAEL